MFLPALLVFSLFLAGCTQLQGTLGPTGPLPQATAAANDSGFQPLSGVVVQGSRVSIRYAGSFENGTLFDTNIVADARAAGLNPPEELPLLNVTVGAQEVIPGFEKALLAMRAGQEKKVKIAPEDAYGQPSAEYVVRVNASEFSKESAPQVGATVATSTGARGTVTAVEGDKVTIDFNHPLAGKTLVFKIIVEKIG